MYERDYFDRQLEFRDHIRRVNQQRLLHSLRNMELELPVLLCEYCGRENCDCPAL